MTYRIFYLNQYVTERASRDMALDFIDACNERREDFEILDDSDLVAS